MEMVKVNDIVISEMRRSDGYVNATRMCKAVGKKFNDYYRLDATQAFLTSLEGSAGYPVDLLVTTITNGVNEARGTWVHPYVATDLAAWCSPTFRASVAVLTARYLSGQVTTEESLAAARRMATAQAELPPPEVRVANMVTSLEKLGISMDNPRYAQDLRDVALNILIPNRQRAIHDDDEEREVWRGVVEIAEDMEFHVTESNRGALGRYVKQRALGELQPKTETRLVNGRDTNVNIYKDCDEIREFVAKFFEEAEKAKQEEEEKKKKKMNAMSNINKYFNRASSSKAKP